MSNFFPPPSRDLASRFRRSTPRSRGGCITCKARHVKCDESKPCCTRCATSGHKCDYVLPSSKKSGPPAPITHARPHANPVIIIQYQPSVDIPGNAAERRSFHYIRAKNLTEIFGRCEIDLWDTTMLLYSHFSPVVRKSLLALSAIYEVHEGKSIIYDRTAISLGSLQEHALSLYIKAVAEIIRCLRKNPKSSSSSSSLRSLLLSCLIFSWIEIMLSNLDTAQWHLDSGIKIINSIAAVPANISQREDPDEIYGSLHRSFLRLKFQTTIDLKGVPMIEESSTETRSKRPGRVVQRQSNSVQAPMMNEAGIQEPQSPKSELSWTLQGRLRQIERLRQADEAIKQMPASSIQAEDRKRSLTYVYVRLSRAVLSLMTEARCNGQESLDDSRYTDVIDIVQEIYEKRKFIQLSPISLDFGVNAPLLFTLRWCKDIRVKIRAYELLKAGSRREGLWYREDIIAFVEQQGLLWQN